VTHYYAWFVYDTKPMWPNFNVPSSNVYGPEGGAGQTVLSYVAFPDNESFHFDYNSYGQVYQIPHKAPDGHELGHTRYNISDADFDYQLGADYVNRRIIGLPFQKLVYDGPTGALMSKVQYYYDWGGGDMFVDTRPRPRSTTAPTTGRRSSRGAATSRT
jgi:hypothetical protein